MHGFINVQTLPAEKLALDDVREMAEFDTMSLSTVSSSIYGDEEEEEEGEGELSSLTGSTPPR